jgi:hypothetical protein
VRWHSFEIDAQATPVLLAVGMLVLSVLLALTLVRILPALGPTLDLDLIAAGTSAVRPRVLEPMAAIDTLSDVRVAVDSLTEWARGEVLDLWSPAAPHARRLKPPNIPQVQMPSHPRFSKQSARQHTAVPQLENGTELVDVAGTSGAGELHAVNNTGVQAIVSLTRNGKTARAIYLCPNGAASMRHVQLGRYAVDVQLGNGIDARRLRFREVVQSQHLGPFDFWEVTSSGGSSGQRYEVVMNNHLD